MKKVVVIASFLAGLLSINSCSKKNDASAPIPSSNNSINKDLSISSKQKSWGICCVWNGVDRCVPPAVNCFDEVVVKPKYTEVVKALKHFDDAVNGSSTDVASFFVSDDAKILFPDLVCFCDNNEFKDYLNKLISGNYYITKTQQGNKFYYLVKQNGTNVVDFVLTIKKEGLGNND